MSIHDDSRCARKNAARAVIDQRRVEDDRGDRHCAASRHHVGQRHTQRRRDRARPRQCAAVETPTSARRVDAAANEIGIARQSIGHAYSVQCRAGIDQEDGVR